jgi:hypothetical protein
MSKLTVQNAQINTATVEVKTLTISGKQVTLAVFRQLLLGPLISPDGILNGVPWGIVNYHADKCADDEPHQHVVWQRNNELLRSKVMTEPRYLPFESRDGDVLISDSIVGAVRGNRAVLMSRDDLITQASAAHDRPAHSILCVMYEVQCQLKPNRTASTLLLLRDSWTDLDAIGTHLAAAERELGAIDRRLLLNRFRAGVQEEDNRRRRHAQILDELAELPQLFIAV